MKWRGPEGSAGWSGGGRGAGGLVNEGAEQVDGRADGGGGALLVVHRLVGQLVRQRVLRPHHVDELQPPRQGGRRGGGRRSGSTRQSQARG